MQYSNLDTDSVLSCSQQWLELNHKWGEPVDLEVADDRGAEGRLVLASSSADPDRTEDRTTFDSAKLIHRLKRTKEAARSRHDSRNDYNSAERISSNNGSDAPTGRNTLVENICREIDAILPRIYSGVNDLKRAVDLATLRQDHQETSDVTLEDSDAKNQVIEASFRSEVDRSSTAELSESSLSSLNLSMEDGEGYSADVESFDDSVKVLLRHSTGTKDEILK